MKRVVFLVIVLLCAALFTAATSASLLSPLLPRGGDIISPASAAQARPMVWQGKTIFKYVVKLRPTKINGKLVGDEDASGKYILKAVRYSATSYYIKYTVDILNIRSGGEAPTMDARSLLDELMGKDRDLPLDQKKRKLRFDDPEVCRYHLVAFCPNDLFPNTRSDLGPCPRVHDDALREEFLASTKVAQFEAELLAYLERLIADLERKIKRCHERLDKELPAGQGAAVHAERISAIGAQVQALLRQAEQEGEQGLVDRAQATMGKVDALNREKEALLRSAVPDAIASSVIQKEKRLQVCEVCGAMQANTDTEKRLASHLDGKQHLGYARIRETAEMLRKKREEEREKRRREMGLSDAEAGREERQEEGKEGSQGRPEVNGEQGARGKGRDDRR
ncbi:unnamed protein product, partial [Closterium sp. Yama58-4]